MSRIYTDLRSIQNFGSLTHVVPEPNSFSKPLMMPRAVDHIHHEQQLE